MWAAAAAGEGLIFLLQPGRARLEASPAPDFIGNAAALAPLQSLPLARLGGTSCGSFSQPGKIFRAPLPPRGLKSKRLQLRLPPPSFSRSFSIPLFSPQPHGPRGKSRACPCFPWGQQVAAGLPSHPIPGARLIPRLLSLKTNLFPPQHVILGTVIPTIPRYSLKLHPHFPASCLLREYSSVLFQLPDTEPEGGTSQSTMSSSHALTLQLGSC